MIVGKNIWCGDTWLNEYGALVEWHWQVTIEVHGEDPLSLLLCPS